MVIDKPRLNRDTVLRVESLRRNVKTCLEQTVSLLMPDERLGRPERQGHRLIIPIHPAPDDDEPAAPPASPPAQPGALV